MNTNNIVLFALLLSGIAFLVVKNQKSASVNSNTSYGNITSGSGVSALDNLVAGIIANNPQVVGLDITKQAPASSETKSVTK